MAAHGRNDARSAARLLARTAKEAITNPEIARARTVALNNVYRLLEAYRANPFFGVEQSSGQAMQKSAETLTLTTSVERHVKDVRRAMEQAIDSAFENQPKQKAIESIEGVLRSITYPEKNFKKPSSQERKKTKQFFEELHRRLELG